MVSTQLTVKIHCKSRKAFSGEKYLCVEEVNSLISGASGCLVFFFVFWLEFFFFNFVLRSCFSEGKDCFIFSYGHDSGDQGGKANFIHVI